MPEPVVDVHTVVVDEVEADGAAWLEILEGVRLLKRKSKHDSGWSLFRSPCGFVSKPRTRAMFSVEVRCIANGRARQECTSLFFGCLVAVSMVDGSGAQSIRARHREHATVQRRSWTLMNSLACFFSPSLPVESGKQHA